MCIWPTTPPRLPAKANDRVAPCHNCHISARRTQSYNDSERLTNASYNGAGDRNKSKVVGLRSMHFWTLVDLKNSISVTRYRHTEQNLRSRLHRIADRAGVERWPKPFICLRASRRTELERTGRFANHVLNDWFGHSGAIAETHYLQTTEADFDLAGGPIRGPITRASGFPKSSHQTKKPR